MGDNKTNKITIIAGRSGIVAEARRIRKGHVGWKIFALGVGASALIAIIIVLVVFENRDRTQKIATINQKQLQTTIASVDAVGDPNKLSTDSTALINGAKGGSYKVSDEQLASAYANRGDVEFNNDDYKAALTDYQQAVKLDASQQQLVGRNEFVIRYKQGERKQLIPLLQTLQKPYKNNYATGMQEHYEEYQSYIDDLQAGKELEL
jgi:tetratricopeptide (TPR) repeat protein